MNDFIEEGRQARRKGLQADACPYSFANSGCLAALNYDRFESEFREKFDAWFTGWLEEDGRTPRKKWERRQ